MLTMPALHRYPDTYAIFMSCVVDVTKLCRVYLIDCAPWDFAPWDIVRCGSRAHGLFHRTHWVDLVRVTEPVLFSLFGAYCGITAYRLWQAHLLVVSSIPRLHLRNANLLCCELGFEFYVSIVIRS